MKCLVIETFKRRGQIQPIESVIDISEDAIQMLVGYVRPINKDDKYYLIGKWRDLAAELFEKHGMGFDEANYQAAVDLHLLSFASELKLKMPITGSN